MERSWFTRLGVIILVTLGSIWFLVPTYYSFFHLPRADRNNVKKLEEVLPKWAPPASYRLSLGLDLQGGIHMVMRVDTKTALMKRTERRGSQMVGLINQKKLGTVTQVSDPEQRLVTLTVADPATVDSIEKELTTAFDDFSKQSRDGTTLVYKLNDANVDYFMNDAVEQAMLVIRRRIDKWGVAEVDVRRLGTDSIQISLPGQSDPEQAKELIGTTAQLEFRLVEESGDVFKDMIAKEAAPASSDITLVSSVRNGDGNEPPTPFLESTDREALLSYLKGKAPEGKNVLLHCVEAEAGKKCLKYTTFVVTKDAALTGETLTGADARQNTTDNKVEVFFQFNSQGAKDLETLTGNNSGRRMAIVLDDNVVMAPSIHEKIAGGSGVITLGRRGQLQDRLKEAHMLALALKAGALPAPVTPGEIRQVGASLGDELIRKGALSALVGLGLVLLFMAVYYRLSGLTADVALVINALLILAGLALFNATLTLPGIAGFVLTLGIAVDANVLINERIREELAAGKSARVAVDQGYDRAFWTIFDAHVTTLIAGLILRQTGTGPVQGFATTLIIGIIASLFTSIVVTRVITTYLVHGRKAETVSIEEARSHMQIIKGRTNFDFIGKRRIAIFVSSVINLAVIIGIAIFGFNFGVDFAGGTVVELKFKNTVSEEAVREGALKGGLNDLQVQRIGSAEENSVMLRMGGVTQLTAENEKLAEDAIRNLGQISSLSKDLENGLINFRSKAKLDPAAVKAAVASTGAGVKEVRELGEAEGAGFDYQVVSAGMADKITAALKVGMPEAEFEAPRRVDYVGPQVGNQLRNKGIASLLLALLSILLYVAFRFDLKFGPGALVASIHDVVMVAGYYLVSRREFNLTSIAVLLTVLGYSINDTIVIYDRIREEMVRYKGKPLAEIINIAVNDTLSRTILTSGVTALSLVGLLVFGTGEIFDFAAAMLVGIIVGTYSSVYIASPLTIWLDEREAKRVKEPHNGGSNLKPKTA